MKNVEILESRFLLSGTGYSFSSIARSYPVAPDLLGDHRNDWINGPIIADSNGNLFGTGTNSENTIFEFEKNDSFIKTLATFPSITPTPSVSLIDGFGDIFGTLDNDAAPGISSSMFELPAGASATEIIASFPGMIGQLTIDKNGNIFALAGDASPGAPVTIIELPNGASSISDLASFGAREDFSSSGPRLARLVVDQSGDLFGWFSPIGESGRIFELPIGSSQIVTLASFVGGKSGKFPSGMTFDPLTGELVGVTSAGGRFNHGTIFELPTDGAKITTLASLRVSDGTSPGDIVSDGEGNLFGVTGSGRRSLGSIFELPAGGRLVDLISGLSGPSDHLSIDSSGNLYGTIIPTGDSAYEDGGIYELTKGVGYTGGTVQPEIMGSSLPNYMHAGEHINGSVLVGLTNTGTTEITDGIAIYINAYTYHPDGTEIDMQIAAISRPISIKSGRQILVRVPIKTVPSNLPAGSYLLEINAETSAGYLVSPASRYFGIIG